MPTLQDMINQYGGRWYDFGRLAGQPGWFRTPGIDPIGRPVWNPQYGWQDWDQIRNMGGDYSSLKPQYGDVMDYFKPKPMGTSDPQLRARYGQDWGQAYNYYQQYGVLPTNEQLTPAIPSGMPPPGGQQQAPYSNPYQQPAYNQSQFTTQFGEGGGGIGFNSPAKTGGSYEVPRTTNNFPTPTPSRDYYYNRGGGGSRYKNPYRRSRGY